MPKTQPEATNKQQIPIWVHYLLIAGLFISGFLYEFFSASSKTNLSVILILILLAFLAFLATFLFIWKNNSIRLLKSRLLTIIVVWGLILALNLVVYWRNWYQSLFEGSTNIFIVLLVGLIVYVLASAYNVFFLAKQLVIAALAGYALGTFLAGLILAANYLEMLNFPNLRSSKDLIIINLTLLSTLSICLLPKLFVIYERRKNKLAISFLLGCAVVIAALIWWSGRQDKPFDLIDQINRD